MDTLILCQEADAYSKQVEWVIAGHIRGPDLPFEPRGFHALHQCRYMFLVLAFTDDRALGKAWFPSINSLIDVTEDSLHRTMEVFAKTLFSCGYKGEAAVASAKSVWRIRPGYAERSPYSYTVIGDRANGVMEQMAETNRTPNVSVCGLIASATGKTWPAKSPSCRFKRYKVVP